MRVRTIFRLWLPLAVSFELMMMEGPALQGAIGRLPDSALHLAAWGLMMQISLLIESPVIMLLSTAIALVRDGQSFRVLRRFMLLLLAACTVLSALVAFTPLFDVVAGRIMGQPAPIVAVTRPALQIMLLWTAAIGWRRFFQGVLVRNGATRLVSYGTSVRLIAAVSTAFGLTVWGRMPGVQVGACALMAAVTAEAIATTIFALPVTRRVLAHVDPDAPLLTLPAVARFHAPLALTTLLTLLAPPLTGAALARLHHPEDNLAAWAVVSMTILVIRGWGLALQEIAVAQGRKPEAQPALLRFTWMVGGLGAVVTLLLVFTPLLTWYFRHVLHLPENLIGTARFGVGACFLFPLFGTLAAHSRGLLVAHDATPAVYKGMAVNLTTNIVLLALGVVLNWPGMLTAAVASTLAAIAEYAFLAQFQRMPRYFPLQQADSGEVLEVIEVVEAAG